MRRRGYAVDVGVIERVEKDADGKSVRKRYEIDFVVNSGFRRVYVQSALEMATEEKTETERRSLKLTGDFFRKIIVTGGNERQWQDNDGIVHVGVIPFLLDETILFGATS